MSSRTSVLSAHWYIIEIGPTSHDDCNAMTSSDSLPLFDECWEKYVDGFFEVKLPISSVFPHFLTHPKFVSQVNVFRILKEQYQF